MPPQDSAAASAGAPARRRFGSSWRWPAAAALFAVTSLALATALIYRPRTGEIAEPIRFTVTTPPEATSFGNTPGGADVMPVAVSPDGRWLTYGARIGGRQQLWLRALEGIEARPLPGTDGARYPFWSPDSRSIGFFTINDLRKVDVAGGTAQKIADVATGRGGTWNRDGTILIGTLERGLFRVAATGALDPVASSGAGDELVGQYPVFLPDGRHFLYWGIGGQVQNAIYIGTLDSNERQLLVAADHGAQYAAGQLLFVSGRSLMAQPFDPVSRKMVGAPVLVAESVAVTSSGYAAFSASDNGILVTGSNPATSTRLTWFDRSGKPP